MDVIEKSVVHKPFYTYSLGIDLSFMRVTDDSWTRGTALNKLCWKEINWQKKNTKSFNHALGMKPRVFSSCRRKKKILLIWALMTRSW